MKTLQSRGAGILLHISSLPSNYGIGTFGEEAYRFVDFLEDSAQSYWQVLPLGQTGYGDSPYQSYSAFAGNPYFIDLDKLVSENLIKPEEIHKMDFGDDLETVDYDCLFKHRCDALRLAFSRSRHHKSEGYKAFIEKNRSWLEDYSLFMSLKTHFKNTSWQSWNHEIKIRDPQTMEKYRHALSEEIEFWKFVQFEFFIQWNALKSYANNHGVKIIGDLPIYVSGDSADAWAESELFELDKDKNPIRVAGVPPDFFSQTGQLWGNPLYDWDVIEQKDYDWWKRRMRMSADLYDIIRIDHFIGFVRYYAIPASHDDARNGTYEQGPAMKLIQAIREVIPGCEIIAENLGVTTPEVDSLLKETGYPGMKILLFAFNGLPENKNLIEEYAKNNVVYTGTHDNDTVVGYFEKDPSAFETAKRYLGAKYTGRIAWDLIRLAYQSNANTAIIPLQDFLELSSNARMNTPQTVNCNWKWRFRKDMLSEELAEKINALTKYYNR